MFLTVINKAIPPEFIYYRYKFRLNMLKSEEECVKNSLTFFVVLCCVVLCCCCRVERVSLLGVRRRS